MNDVESHTLCDADENLRAKIRIKIGKEKDFWKIYAIQPKKMANWEAKVKSQTNLMKESNAHILGLCVKNKDQNAFKTKKTII
jgi:hypothetical protein